MEATIGKPVTFAISSSCLYLKKPFIKVGQLIKFTKKRGLKRSWAEVTQSSYDTATLKAVYRPAPKSKLIPKSVFSKFKGKIIPMTIKNNLHNKE